MSNHAVQLSRVDLELLLRAMALVDAGTWPWSFDQDGTPPIKEARERAAWERARGKLRDRLARHDGRRKMA